jgi:hypothetical protein
MSELSITHHTIALDEVRAGHWIAEECPDYLIEQLTTFFAEK